MKDLSEMSTGQLYSLDKPAKIEVSKLLSKEFLKEYPDLRDMEENLLVTARAIIQGQLLDEVTAKYPADWKEAVKERFFPPFLLKRYPVKYTTLKLEAVAYYPKVAMNMGARVHFLVNDSIYLGEKNDNRGKNRR